MRRLVCALVVSLLIGGVWAKGGVLAGAGPLSVIRTQFFDIIFPDECAAAADCIAAVADGYYQEISALLETACDEHFAVTITRSVESMNAYFTVAPYNRIVLYDTPPDTSLDSHADTLESVFYHELTHAVTTNIRSPFAGFLAGLLGDWFAPAGFTQTNFMLEGAAVSFESRGGAGRVHSPYSTQLVRQAKLDGRFPDWRDVTGARDTFPGGTDAYAFGALFSQFLQETYGMKKYAEFWRTAGSLHGFKRSVKKTYGKPIAALWKDFASWVRVPDDVTPAIDPPHGTDDFFVANGFAATKTGFSRQNERWVVFKCVATSAHGIAWYEQKTGGVWYAAVRDGTVQKPKKLFVCAAVSRLSLSDDGEWLAVSYLYASAQTKTAVCRYHFPSGRLLPLPVASVRDAGFVRDRDGALLLACVNIAQDIRSIDFYAVGTRKNDVVLVKRVLFAADEIPFSPCAAADGGFACIVKKGLDWRICLYENDTAYRAFGTPQTILHHLHGKRGADGRLAFSFSYAPIGSQQFPRTGLLYVNPADFASELVLQDDDVSGSVLDAAFFPGDRGERLVYTAAFYDTQRLMQMDVSRRTVVRHKGAAPQAESADAYENDSVVADSAGHERLSYHPFRYYRHGMLIPVGMVSSYRRDELSDYSFGYTSAGTAFVGATFGSSQPWGDKMFVVSGGWNPFDKNGGMSAHCSGGTDTFSYRVNANVLFDGGGFMQATGGISLAKTLYARFGNSFSLGAHGISFYGHDAVSAENRWAGTARAYAQFSSVRKMSPRYADYGGVWVQPFVFAERVFFNAANVGMSLGARVPGLFPLALSAAIFPSSTEFAHVSASVVLCSWEVQKGIPLALYVDRIYVRAAYAGRVAYDGDGCFDVRRTAAIVRGISRADYRDSVTLTVGAVSAINAGILSRVTFDVGLSLQYFPRAQNNGDKMRLGAGVSLVY